MHKTLSKRLSEPRQSYVVAEALMLALVIGDALIVGASRMTFLIFGELMQAVKDMCSSLIGLAIFAIGNGVRAPLLAVASSYIDSDYETASLYTLLSVTDAFAHTIGDPLLQTIWKRALIIGDPWLILPFIATLVGSCNLQPYP